MVVLPTVRYGSESWTIKERDISQIHAVEMRCLTVKGCTRLDHIKDEHIRKELKIHSVQSKIFEHRQSWINI